MLVRIIRWIMGYVKFEVRGGFPEKFINLSIRKGLNIWDIRKSSGNLIGKVLAKEYRHLRFLSRESESRVRLKKKYGLPFFVIKYRKRKGVLVGIGIFIVLIYTLSMYIWSVEVTGNETISSEEIISVMEDLGVSPGSLKNMIDIPLVQQSAMIKLPDTAWLSVNITGSRANISIKEKVPPPQILTKEKPCNIKAKSDGQIERIEAYKGTVAVNNGDAVLKGQILISGVVEDSFGVSKFVHSEGKAYGYTKRKIVEKSGLSQMQCSDTGKVIRRYRIKIFGLEIPIRMWSNPDDSYRREFYKSDLRIKDIVLPITVYKEEWYEQACKEIVNTNEEAFNQAEEKILKREQEELKGCEILKKQINHREENGVCIVECEYACKEDIGEKEEIVFESS